MLTDLGLPRLRNARDLGGLETVDGERTRHGVLVRSAAPVQIDAPTQRALADYGLRTAIDLREPEESDAHPATLEQTGMRLIALPLVDRQVDFHKTRSLGDFYDRLLDVRGAGFARTVSTLAAAETLPALFFCSAGKDRTGLTTALLLSALDVTDDAVIGDYVETKRSMDPEFKAELVERARVLGFSEQIIAVTADAPAELMSAALQRVRAEHGDAAGYLRHHGLRDDELAALRTALLG